MNLTNSPIRLHFMTIFIYYYMVIGIYFMNEIRDIYEIQRLFSIFKHSESTFPECHTARNMTTRKAMMKTNTKLMTLMMRTLNFL